MIVSVIVPCRNEEKYINYCVESLFTNGFDQSQMEVIVVDGMSNDATVQKLTELQAKFSNLIVCTNLQKVTPNALNIGIANAKGDFIMIASAHSAFQKGYIQALVDNISKLPDAIAVGGNMKTEVKNASNTAVAIQRILSSKFGVGNAMFRVGTEKVVKVDTVPFGLYKADVLKQSGGYDERLIRNHDIELSKRLLRKGGNIYLIPEAKCTYFAREHFKEMALNNFRNGKWNILTVWITGNFSSLSIRHFVPMIFLLSLMLPTLLSFFFLPFIFVGLFSLTSYLLALTYVSLKLDKRGTTIWHLIWGYFVLHCAYGFGSLVGILIIPKFALK
jgi:cellulose synthase/poly-beta-1,6-N-acetylglucosamine synthase-like glycosyltransferase